METPTTFADLINLFGKILNVSIQFMIAGVFVFIVWKLFDTWILHADDEQKREEGKQTAIVAVIALVVITLVWGIVNLVRDSLFGA